MPRFFKENFGTEPYIDGSDAAHIARSLRMQPGERVTVCDGFGNDYDCEIQSVTKDRVAFTVLGSAPSASEPDVEVTLCTCLLKADKFEQVVRHSVELGVCKIQPLLSSNCVSRPDAAGMAAKTTRWQKIAAEAAGQCGRGIIPQVLPAQNLSAWTNNLGQFDLVLFFYEAGGQPMGETLWAHAGAKHIAVVTGPEGGFTMEEAAALEQAGAKTITLGKRILRAETAPLAALTGVMLLTDNLE